MVGRGGISMIGHTEKDKTKTAGGPAASSVQRNIAFFEEKARVNADLQNVNVQKNANIQQTANAWKYSYDYHEAQEQQRTDEMRREECYTAFLARYSTPPDEMEVRTGGTLKEESVGWKERKRQNEALSALGKKHTLFSTKDMEELSRNKVFSNEKMRTSWENSKYRQSEITNAETMRQLAAGDYSNFENVQPALKNVAASKALIAFKREHPEVATDAGFDAEAFVRQMKTDGGVSALMNPVLRLGFSLARHTDDVPAVEKENYRRLDEAMSAELMVETLVHSENVETYQNRLVSECGVPQTEAEAVARKETEAAKAQQIEIAKRLLLMQLSDFKVYDKAGNASDWQAPVAVALSHCRRVVLTMPLEKAGEKNTEKAMWNSIFHSANNEAAQDKKRTASTHSLKRRKAGKSGPTKELKIRLGNYIGQRGMNCAIGGIGNSGISGKMIRNNGSCGHFYSMYKESRFGNHGAILFGLESDSAGVVNQMGHKHNAKATAEAASSLGGQRVDEIGADYGGRQCDLTHLTPKEIQGWMEALERKMTAWNSADDGGGQEREQMMRTLAGKKLSAPELWKLWTQLN